MDNNIFGVKTGKTIAVKNIIQQNREIATKEIDMLMKL